MLAEKYRIKTKRVCSGGYALGTFLSYFQLFCFVFIHVVTSLDMLLAPTFRSLSFPDPGKNKIGYALGML